MRILPCFQTRMDTSGLSQDHQNHPSGLHYMAALSKKHAHAVSYPKIPVGFQRQDTPGEGVMHHITCRMGDNLDKRLNEGCKQII